MVPTDSGFVVHGFVNPNRLSSLAGLDATQKINGFMALQKTRVVTHYVFKGDELKPLMQTQFGIEVD